MRYNIKTFPNGDISLYYFSGKICNNYEYVKDSNRAYELVESNSIKGYAGGGLVKKRISIKDFNHVLSMLNKEV